MDRRDFLRIAGGVAFVPHVAHAAEADEIEIGIVGYDAKEAHVLGS